MSRVADRIDSDSPVPAWVVLGGVGTATLTVALWNFLSEVVLFGLTPGPLVAAAMGVSLSSGVIYVSARLRRGDLDSVEAWTVALTALAAGAFVGLGYTLTIVVRVIEGRNVAEPAFPLVVMWSLGLLGGAVLGWEQVERLRSRASVTESRDALAFTNSLLRHDVRNALQVVDGRAALLADHHDDEVRENAAAIRGQADSLEGLITEVQSVTEVLTGEGERETVDLVSVLNDVVDAAEEGHHGLTVERRLPDELPVAAGEALYAVFRNLVDNAAEHAGSDSVTVVVSGERVGDDVRVRVSDDGRGIPEDERERIFESGVSTDDGGYGLYVVDTIVNRLGGDISVETSDMGGAAFVVDLPAADRHSEVDAEAFSE